MALCLLVANAYAQSTYTNYVPDLFPKAPETSTLESVNSIEVSKYTGLPDITIPLWSLSSGDLSVNMEMKYHAQGIKVEDKAGPMGLKWALSGGGRISRIIRGIPDEKAGKGWIKTANNLPSTYDKNNSAHEDYFEAVANKLEDSEPDLFNATIPGIGSFEFVFDQAGNIYMSPHKNVVITHNGNMADWVITDGVGNKYFFNGGTETVKSERVCSNGSPEDPDQLIAKPNAWLLSKIESHDGQNAIHFQYDSYIETDNVSVSETKYFDLYQGVRVGHFDYSLMGINLSSFSYGGTGCSKPTDFNCTSIVSQVMYKTKKVYTDEGSFEIRYDAVANPVAPIVRADIIDIKDANSNVIRQYRLEYGEFPGDARLRLDKIIEIGNNASEKPATSFTYESTPLPTRNSKSQDYYGFYNGASNSTLIPTTYDYIPPYENGADRFPNFTYAKAGVLEKITYPTGGETQFEYEMNDFSVTPYPETTIKNKSLIKYAPSVGTFTETFTITSPLPNNKFLVIVDLIEVENDVDGEVGATLWIKDSNGNTILDIDQNLCQYGGTVIGKKYLSLDPGTYTIKAELGLPNDEVKLVLRYFDGTGNIVDELPGGGLRAKKITQSANDGSPDMVTKYEYIDFTNPTQTSGTHGVPLYFGHIHDYYSGSNICLYPAISSYAQNSLSNTQGSSVGYFNVREVYGSNGENGHKDYTFTSFIDHPDEAVGGQLGGDRAYLYGVPMNNRDHRRGLLLKESVYDKNGNIQSQQEFDYPSLTSVTAPGYNTLAGARVGWWKASEPQWFKVVHYTFTSEWVKMEQQKNKVYDGVNVLETTTDITLADITHLQPQSTVTTNSSGSILISEMYYPNQFSVTPTSWMTDMLNNHQDALPIVQLQKKDGVYVSGRYNEYKTDLNNNTLLYKVYSLETQGGINTSIFSDILTNNSLPTSDFQLEVTYDIYDDHGRLLEYHLEDGISNAILWDDLSVYPIAKVENAQYSDIAFTSFETNAAGKFTLAGPINTTEAFSGSQSYDLGGGNITLSNLSSSQTYIVSFWTKGSVSVNGGGGTLLKTAQNWNYYETEISGISSLTLSGSGYLDEVAVYPKEARISTYTYKPLTGVSSISDIQGESQYFEYDNFGRLKYVKDSDGNILSETQYNYRP